ncbi:MAG TPA: radical SAM protein [Candidatus Paceibacterota bacterium]|nr:radical SAM protein [Candidatus Paceibacterota bacterium]
MGNRVFLFETSTEDQNRTMDITSNSFNYPFSMGLLYISSVLKEKGHNVITKDYSYFEENKCLEDIKKEIINFRPEVVGISVLSMTRVSTYKSIRLIKSINPDIKIILGGVHPTVMYEQLLNNFPVDVVCIGEAELIINDLVETITSKKRLNKINNIAYKNKGKIVVTKRNKINMELDDLPYPDYDAYINENIKTVNMTTSRGCPNKCSFCCLHNISQQRWRPRNIMKVVDEIEFITKKYPYIKNIQFIDDTLTLDNKRVIEICKEILKRNIKMNFSCQARIKPVSNEMFFWMEKAGFETVCFGIETGSPELLKSIHKNITVEDCLNTFKMIKEFRKLKPVKYLMVGFHGENEKTVNETIDLAKKLHKIVKMDFFAVSPLWVYPGTEAYEIGKNNGWINDSYWLTDKPCPLYTFEHSEKWLKQMQNKISIETMLSQGKLYFIKRTILKLASNPRYYIKRVFNF